MNELLLILQLVVALCFTLGAARMGKEALMAVIVMQGFLANLLVLKQFPFFGVYATGGDPFIVADLVGLQLLQERFGMAQAKRVTWICLLLLLYPVACSQIHLGFRTEGGGFDSAYLALLQPAPRLFCASLLTSFLSQRFSLFLLRHMPRARVVVLVMTVAFDTLIFTFLGLYGLLDHLAATICGAFIVKLILALATPLILQLFRKVIPYDPV